MLAPLSDDLPPADITSIPTLTVPPSYRDSRRQYYETPSTVVDRSPLRSPSSGVVGVGDREGGTTVMDRALGHVVSAAGIDTEVSRGDGRHEGG